MVFVLWIAQKNSQNHFFVNIYFSSCILRVHSLYLGFEIHVQSSKRNAMIIGISVRTHVIVLFFRNTDFFRFLTIMRNVNSTSKAYYSKVSGVSKSTAMSNLTSLRPSLSLAHRCAQSRSICANILCYCVQSATSCSHSAGSRRNIPQYHWRLFETRWL